MAGKRAARGSRVSAHQNGRQSVVAVVVVVVVVVGVVG